MDSSRIKETWSEVREPRGFPRMGMPFSRRPENPLVTAEVRRWKNRPFTYLGFLLLLLVLAYFSYLISNTIWRNPLFFGRGRLALDFLSFLLFLTRPSTLVTAFLVWRAVVSFREGPMFEPFRTTKLTPREFMRGVILLPVALMAGVITLYVCFVLVPRLLQYNDLRMLYQIPVIMIEGGLNGILMALVALYYGYKGRARLHYLFYVILWSMIICALHAVWTGYLDRQLTRALNEVFGYARPQWYRALNQPLLVLAIAKLAVIIPLWRRIERMIAAVPENERE